MCRGWTTSFWNSIEEKNHLVLVQIDFPVPEPLSGIDSPRALCNFKNAFQKLLCFYSPITIDLSFCLYTKDPKTSFEGSNSTAQWVSNTHHLNSLSFYPTPKAYPLCLCSVATAAKLTAASTDLVLRSPLNLMVLHVMQILLFIENTQCFSVSRLTFYEILLFSFTHISIHCCSPQSPPTFFLSQKKENLTTVMHVFRNFPCLTLISSKLF